MDKRYAIFDMDGTLVDSMGCWRRLSQEFLGSRGVEKIPPEILEQIKPMTMLESAALFIRTFGLSGTPESLTAEMDAVMEGHYRRDILLKPGVEGYLEDLARRDVRMCVASATAERLVKMCLGRLGVLDRFEFLLSCETAGVGKDRPDIYLAAAERLGCAPGEAAVYEDAIFAARTAKEAGFYVVGVYDEWTGDNWERLARLADETILSFGPGRETEK